MEVTADPFLVMSPASIELVIHHLTVKEALEMSEVSKGWYNKIAQVKSLLRRLKISVKCKSGINEQNCSDNSEFTEKTAEIILKSRRKFHTLEVQLCCHCLCKMKGLFLDASHLQTWKHVTITHSRFELIAWMVMCLVSIQDSVETMFLQFITINEEDDFDIEGPWNFPKLKYLTIENCHSQTLQFCFKNCTNLEKLIFIDGWLPADSSPMNALIRVLQRNESLKVLSIGGNVFFQLMERFRGCQLFCTFKFRLQKLAASSFFWSTQTWAYDVLAEFVRSQSNSLESIVFSRFMGFPAICAAFDCPRLFHVTMAGELTREDAAEWRHYVLNKNKTIESMSMCMQPSGFDAGFYQDVFAAAPNVKRLYISWMNDSLLAHLTVNNRSIKNIFIEYLSLSMDTILTQNPLPGLETLEVLKSFTHIPAGIQSHDKRKRTNFQGHFYKFFYTLCAQSSEISKLDEDTYKNIMRILTLLE